MAARSSTPAWKIPWMEEAGRLQSMGSLRVGHDWATSLSLFTFTHWRRKWQPTQVFLPGESQGRGILVGCRLWGCTESETTEVTQQQQQQPLRQTLCSVGKPAPVPSSPVESRPFQLFCQYFSKQPRGLSPPHRTPRLGCQVCGSSPPYSKR